MPRGCCIHRSRNICDFHDPALWRFQCWLFKPPSGVVPCGTVIILGSDPVLFSSPWVSYKLISDREELVLSQTFSALFRFAHPRLKPWATSLALILVFTHEGLFRCGHTAEDGCITYVLNSFLFATIFKGSADHGRSPILKKLSPPRSPDPPPYSPRAPSIPFRL